MRFSYLVLVFLLLGLAACNQANPSTLHLPTQMANQTDTISLVPTALPTDESTATPTLPAPRLLTICLMNEPRSLFLYSAVSSSEKSVLGAIYDGPINIQDFTPAPVIVEKIPSLKDGDALLQSVPVNKGDIIFDGAGNLTNLDEGVVYRPSGCTEYTCTQTYSGEQPVQMDQLVVRFKLLPNLQWSDGVPLTAADSVYSYEVARSLYPAALPDLIRVTNSYKSIDKQTVEWTGIPGFMDSPYQAKFFTPLPQHAWANIPVSELSSNEASAKKPVGWGVYVIDEWVPGDHISLHANPLYFKAGQGLPHFDNLVFRFVSNASEGLSAVQVGECDLAEGAAGLETQTESLLQLRDKGDISLIFENASAWDLLEFDIAPIDSNRVAYFASKEVRQAVAMCIDRQALVDQLSGGQMQVADLYLPPEHPQYDAEAKHYTFDPQAASDQLTAAGWIDNDNNPATPRLAKAVNGIPDGTPFRVQFLTAQDAEHQAAAQLIQADLAQCGIQANIVAQPVQQYLASGPEGPVFGRQFDLAQYAWDTAMEPPCSLFVSSAIPGPYPAYPKGWGGVNASGYNNPKYDQACLDATYALPDLPQYQPDQAAAQAIFAEDLPALPLYWHYKVIVGRPDLCGLPQQAVAGSVFSNLELINYGEGCQ